MSREQVYCLNLSNYYVEEKKVSVDSIALCFTPAKFNALGKNFKTERFERNIAKSKFILFGILTSTTLQSRSTLMFNITES